VTRAIRPTPGADDVSTAVVAVSVMAGAFLRG